MPASEPLWLRPDGAGTPLGRLARLPLLGRLLPGAQAMHFNATATYRVRLQAAPAGAPGCFPAWCYEALLIDGVPPEG